MANMYCALVTLLSFLVLINGQAGDFNQPPGVDVWCGRAYRATNSSFDPGGQFVDPPTSPRPLLRLRARPRFNIFVETDAEVAVLVDAKIVHQNGDYLPGCYVPLEGKDPKYLQVEISLDQQVIGTARIPIGSVNNEVKLSIEEFEPKLEAYALEVTATLTASNLTYTSETELSYLPYPEDYGSISRIDNQYGGLYVQRGKDSPWKSIFPYTYYAQWTRYWNEDEGAAVGRPNVSTLDEYAAMGYNLIHPVPTGSLGNNPFLWDEWLPYVERADELGLYFRYDVNLYWPNMTNMLDQVEGLRRHPSILLWYHSDEPDGKTWPLEEMREAYDKIRAVDPYHPVSLVLNCFDFHYEDYSSAADIVASDIYPIGINAMWSVEYDTPCNTTYGTCGCDFCEGSFRDISVRLDEFSRRDELIGWDKVHWFTPQAFGGETFWTRRPTQEELLVMTILAINHGAKGIVQWDFPSVDWIHEITEAMAAVLPSEAVTTFTLGAPRIQELEIDGSEEIDAAIWVHPDNSEVMLSVVNLGYDDQEGEIIVHLPEGVIVSAIVDAVWGEKEWEVKGDTVSTRGLLGLEVSMFVLAVDYADMS